MKIKRSSMSYQFMSKWTTSAIPTNICPYMRRFVGMFFGLVALGVLAGIVVMGLLLGVGILLFGLQFGNSGFVAGLGVFGAVTLIAGTLSMLGFIVYRTVSAGIGKIRGSVRNSPFSLKDTVVYKYAKAKHDKFCHNLTFED